jgi:hypothetical protein
MMKKETDRKALLEAVAIAKRIVSGELDPNEGCGLIGDINRELDWPDELSAFGLLAHEQYDHENIGITAEGCVPDIIEESKKLIDRIS